MAFNARTKDLKSNIYSPTKPASEAAIRAQIDDSIQEVFDNVTTPLLSVTDGSSGADNIGATAVGSGSATTIQGVLEEQNQLSVDLESNKANSADVYLKTETYTKTEVDTIDMQNVKLTGNQTISDVKTFSSSPIVPTPTTDLQTAPKGYVDTEIAGVVLGQIPDNSLTNVKLGTDVKVGSLATLTTTDKSDATSAINEVNQLVTNKDTATDGQVLTSNGNGTSTYEDLPGTVVIDETTLVSDVASYDISWTAGVYKKIVVLSESLISDTTEQKDLRMILNDNSGTVYPNTGTSANGVRGANRSYVEAGLANISSSVSVNTKKGNFYCEFEVISGLGIFRSASTEGTIKSTNGAFCYTPSDEVVKLTLFPASDNFKAGCKFKVLGVKDYA